MHRLATPRDSFYRKLRSASPASRPVYSLASFSTAGILKSVGAILALGPILLFMAIAQMRVQVHPEAARIAFAAGAVTSLIGLLVFAAGRAARDGRRE